MTSELQPLRLTSSSQFSVRLGTTDGEVPIEVVIERKAIDDYFHLRATNPARRKRLVEANLTAIKRIVEGGMHEENGSRANVMARDTAKS